MKQTLILMNPVSLFLEAVTSGDRRKEACAKGHLALCLYKDGEGEKALEHLKEAIDLSAEIRAALLIKKNGETYPNRKLPPTFCANDPPDICKSLNTILPPHAKKGADRRDIFGMTTSGLGRAIKTPLNEIAKRRGYDYDQKRRQPEPVLEAMKRTKKPLFTDLGPFSSFFGSGKPKYQRP